MNALQATVAPAACDDRQLLIQRLHAALDALEADDAIAWRASVDELIQWRTRPLVRGLVRLARELEQVQGGAPGSGSLPEACLRLEHVVRMSEESSHRSLDLIQECGMLLGTLPDAGGEESAATLAAIRSRLSEMTAAQGCQDLTGQVILRVIGLVRAVHAGLGEDTGDAHPLLLGKHGDGPAVTGLDPKPATQDDANALLSALGL